MSSAVNTVDTLNGFFKKVYINKGVTDLIPDGVKLLNDIKFNSKNEMPGESFNMPVSLGMEHGMSWGGPTEGAFALQNSVAGVTREATVRGYQKVMRSSLAYSAVSRALQKGEAAFESASKYTVGKLLKSFQRKLEIEMFYGQKGYGVLSAATPATPSITIQLSDWAPGIWVGANDMPIEVRTSAGVLRGTANIVSVDMDTRVITLDQAIPAAASTDVVWPKGSYGKDMPGLHKIITNTGDLFGIDASQYNLWSGNTYPVGSAALSFAKIQGAVAQAVPKGLEGDVKVYVNPKAWANLITDQAALRMYGADYKNSKMENGAKSLVFHGQTGMIEIAVSIYVKEGHAFVITPEQFLRVGSSDISFQLPGAPDKFVRELENSAGYEIRAYCDQTLFCMAPAVQVIMTGIVNS
jgi:hypothetical protein